MVYNCKSTTLTIDNLYGLQAMLGVRAMLSTSH